MIRVKPSCKLAIASSRAVLDQLRFASFFLNVALMFVADLAAGRLGHEYLISKVDLKGFVVTIGVLDFHPRSR